MMFGLVMEYDKSEIFHFSRAHHDSNPELDLSAIGAPTLKSKTYWRYLRFYFDRCLSFKKYVWYHTSLPLTTTMVNPKIPKNSNKNPTLSPGLQDSSQHVGESPDSLNLLSRTSSRAGK